MEYKRKTANEYIKKPLKGFFDEMEEKTEEFKKNKINYTILGISIVLGCEVILFLTIYTIRLALTI